MRAISLWEPWASLVVLGLKKIETRHWDTPYRGPLLIHAAQRKNIAELVQLFQMDSFRDAFASKGINGVNDFIDQNTFGKLLGVVDLNGTKRTDFINVEQLGIEHDFGNYAAGRFGWFLDNPVKFDTAIPYRGSQGFFTVACEIEGKQLNLLEAAR